MKNKILFSILLTLLPLGVWAAMPKWCSQLSCPAASEMTQIILQSTYCSVKKYPPGGYIIERALDPKFPKVYWNGVLACVSSTTECKGQPPQLGAPTQTYDPYGYCNCSYPLGNTKVYAGHDGALVVYTSQTQPILPPGSGCQ